METKENENRINHKTKREEDRMKELLIRHHSVTSIASNKIDISKLVNDYQKRFSVPKALIIKWLNIKKSEISVRNLTREQQSDRKYRK